MIPNRPDSKVPIETTVGAIAELVKYARSVTQVESSVAFTKLMPQRHEPSMNYGSEWHARTERTMPREEVSK